MNDRKGLILVGIKSKYLRYRDPGQTANVNNVARFGKPIRSLFTSTKVFTLHHHIDVTDENETVVYQANTKFPSLHDKTDITDTTGRQIAHIERKIFTLHQRHFVTMGDGKKFEISTELFHLVRDINNIEGLGWQLRGNIAALNFELYDPQGEVIAVIGQKLLSLHDKYCIDLYRPEAEEIAVAILITLQHMIRDRQANNASFSGSSSD